MIPKEDEEQEALVQWLELKGLKFTAIPNSTWTPSWNQKKKNKRLGLRAGFPDIVVMVNSQMLAIELKRKLGPRGGSLSKISDEQFSWVDSLAKVNGIRAAICFGADEAIEFVESAMK